MAQQPAAHWRWPAKAETPYPTLEECAVLWVMEHGLAWHTIPHDQLLAGHGNQFHVVMLARTGLLDYQISRDPTWMNELVALKINEKGLERARGCQSPNNPT